MKYILTPDNVELECAGLPSISGKGTATIKETKDQVVVIFDKFGYPETKSAMSTPMPDTMFYKRA